MNIRNMLMIVSFAISIAVGLAIGYGAVEPGSAATSASARPLIGFSMDTLKEQRWQGDRDLFVKKCGDLGADVKVESANSDDNQQIKDVQSLLTAGIKVLVIVPHDGLAMARAVDMAHQANVPVIAYDRLVRNCDLDMYVAFDAVQIGEVDAKYLVDHLPTPGKGKIDVIYGAQTDNNAKLMKQGFDNILKPYIDRGDIQVVHADWAEDWKPENAKKIMNAVDHQRRQVRRASSPAGTDGTKQAVRSRRSAKPASPAKSSSPARTPNSPPASASSPARRRARSTSRSISKPPAPPKPPSTSPRTSRSSPRMSPTTARSTSRVSSIKSPWSTRAT